MSPKPHPDEPSDNVNVSPPPLAVSELSERCMGCAAVAMLVLDKFEQQLTVDIRNIEERLVAQDSSQIARTAHALKGAAGAVAAEALRDLAAEIETLARQNKLEAISEELAKVRTEANRCLRYLPTAREALKCGTPEGPVGTESEQ